MVGEEHLAFYDAISPIVLAESIDMSKVFRASRWGRNVWSAQAPMVPRRSSTSDEGDYLNCPMTKAEYDAFYAALVDGRIGDGARFRQDEILRRLPADRGDGASRRGHAALRADEAGRPDRSAHRAASVCRRAAAAGHARRRSLQPGRLPDADQMGRSGARAADDPRTRARRVRALRHGASQHLYLRAEGAAADVADAASRRLCCLPARCRASKATSSRRRRD